MGMGELKYISMEINQLGKSFLESQNPVES